MKLIRQLSLLLLVGLLSACSANLTSDSAKNDSPETEERTPPANSESVVSIDGETMTRDDLAFYTIMEKIMIELNRAEDEANLTGEDLDDKNAYWDEQLRQLDNVNVGLQSMIEIKAMSLLAEEKNYFVPDEKLTGKVETFEQQIKENQAAEQLIQEYGEENYQSQLREYIRQSTLRDRVATELAEDIAEEHPDSPESERNFLLDETFEDLFMDQLASLEVEVQLK